MPIPAPTLVFVTTTEISITSITLTRSATSANTSDLGSAKGFFQNTGAVAGTFTVVGLVLLALLTFLTTCLIRRRRRRKVIFDREVFAKAAGRFEPALLDDKQTSLHEGAIAHMHTNANIYGTYVQQSSTTTSTESSVTKIEENAYGVASVGMEYRMGHDDTYSRQGQVSSDDMHAQSQQDLGYNGSAHPIPTFTTLYPPDTTILKQSTQTSQSVQAQGRGSGFYCQLLKAAGLDPGSRSPHSGGMHRSMSLSRGHKFYVPDPDEAQQSSPAHVFAGTEQGGTGAEPAGMGGVYGGYVDEHERVH